MERLRKWYLNLRGHGEESGPDRLLIFALVAALVAYVVLGGAPDHGWGWAE